MRASFSGDWLASPPPPEAPRFDAGSGMLVLSRHADVLAALREPELVQVGSDGNIDAALKREDRRLRVRVELASMLTRSLLAERRVRIGELAQVMLGRLPRDEPLDLLGDFIQPWVVAVAGKNAPDSAGAESLFLGITDTLPRFLGSAILALLRHPAEMVRLHENPELTPTAIEELLRYGGPVHTLHRRGAGPVECNGVVISPDVCAALRPAAGNRDPQVFPDPHRLDLSRRAAGHLSFGAGPHSCPGAALVRTALGVLLEAIMEQNIALDAAGQIEWRTGSSVFSVISLPVILSGNSPSAR